MHLSRIIWIQDIEHRLKIILFNSRFLHQGVKLPLVHITWPLGLVFSRWVNSDRMVVGAPRLGPHPLNTAVFRGVEESYCFLPGGYKLQEVEEISGLKIGNILRHVKSIKFSSDHWPKHQIIIHHLGGFMVGKKAKELKTPGRIIVRCPVVFAFFWIWTYSVDPINRERTIEQEHDGVDANPWIVRKHPRKWRKPNEVDRGIDLTFKK